ncbi:hypothetical protein PBV52_02225 [Streptomyces sp. T12]|uniref:hypothetical protein n=3 Tax=unclassified Streptomyces TaxID=2593676 RepID=UPI00236708A6|nr:hypothetical protein [Streptomyces sp. T12]WDF35703.1 hypothetical protein PBV52_02225 [Streptomyces sp. T12]
MATTELLKEMAAALAAYGFTPAGQTVYQDEFGDGTGTVGWLRLRTEPRRSPEDDHDFLVVYSEAEGTWSLAGPGAEASAIAATAGVDAAARALATAAARAGGSEPAARMLPDWALMALGAAAVQVVVPFVQTVVGKSAEDAYAALRMWLSRRRTAVDEAPAEASTATEYVSIADPDEDIQLIAPDPVPPAALRRLVHLDVAELRGRTFIWDESRQEWFPCRRSP